MPERDDQTAAGHARISRMEDDYQAVLEFIDRMEQVNRFQDKIETPASIDRIWQIFLADIGDVISLDVCALFLVDDRTHAFTLSNVSPEDQADAIREEIDLQIESGMFSSIINRGQPALIPPMAVKKASTVILLPLATIKGILGAVVVTTRVAEDAVTRESMKLMTLLAKQCALIMENTLLYDHLMAEQDSLIQANEEIKKLSRTDALTGTYNRSYLNEMLPNEIKRAARYGKGLAIILADIDHFKSVNDNFGHQAGDRVLQAFAAGIGELIRTDVDWIGRYGGEEFLIVLPETDVRGATILAERLRKAVSKKKIVTDAGTVRISASFGVTGFSRSSIRRPVLADALFSQADKYLYEAKNMGRNRVVSGEF